MNFFLVLGVLLVVLFLLSLVRVGGDLAYGEAGLSLKLRLGRIHVTLYPLKPKKEKPKREKKRRTESKPKEEPPKPRRPGNTWALVRELLPVVAEAAGRFQNKVRVDRLDLDLTVAADDPATAAIAFGAANGFLGMMVPVLENHFNIKDRNFRTRIDFDRASPSVELAAAFSLTIGQGVALGTYVAFRALRSFLSYKNRIENQKEAV